MDGVCVYDCPRMGQAYLQIMRNGLSIPSNENNLIAPYIMREAGLDVNSKPEIHCKDSIVEDHSIYSEEHNLRLPLKLDCIFSYFETTALMHDEM